MTTTGTSSETEGGEEEDSESSSHRSIENGLSSILHDRRKSSLNIYQTPKQKSGQTKQISTKCVQESMESYPDNITLAVLPLEDTIIDARRHISSLPHELLIRIFRWAVGDHLDARVLGKLARVCKYFYCLTQDPCLWRSICIRRWPSLVVCSKETVHETCFCIQPPQRYGYKSWREMAIWRPHVLLDGCYLCRISYVRPGEAALGASYRPMHLVVYYRGIRFYPDGRMSMLTSSCTPNAIVAALGKRASVLPISVVDTAGISETSEYDSSLVSGDGFLQGTYTWCDPDFINCSLQRLWSEEKSHQTRRFRQARLPNTNLHVTFNIRFQLTSSKKRLHSVLRWDSYVIHTVNSVTQTDYATTLDVSSDQFPAFHFSPVRSYTSKVSTRPL